LVADVIVDMVVERTQGGERTQEAEIVIVHRKYQDCFRCFERRLMTPRHWLVRSPTTTSRLLVQQAGQAQEEGLEESVQLWHGVDDEDTEVVVHTEAEKHTGAVERIDVEGEQVLQVEVVVLAVVLLVCIPGVPRMDASAET